IGAMDAMDSAGRVAGPIVAGAAYGSLGPAGPYWIGVAVMVAAVLAFWNIAPAPEAEPDEA
ncbi:MAG TPA: hypothetical protein VD902_17840, partial [Symbiobacteriaceae bacterium]|nr:hypothetical protein [Symbiobacteriaceae bacterium]